MKRAIDKFLNRLGYYKFEPPKGSSLSESEVLEMFGDYGDNPNFVVFLRDLCNNDVRMYFMASNEDDRRTIRGAHQRTNYFLSLIKKSNDKRNKLRSSKEQ